MSSFVSHFVTLISGIIVGATGKYLADLFTDRRHAHEADSKSQKQFAKIETLMPTLIAEMRNDVRTDPSGTRREFFPYHPGAIFAPDTDTFFYNPEKHPELTSQLAVLVSCSYITDISSATTARYRMTEGFVALLKK